MLKKANKEMNKSSYGKQLSPQKKKKLLAISRQEKGKSHFLNEIHFIFDEMIFILTQQHMNSLMQQVIQKATKRPNSQGF